MVNRVLHAVKSRLGLILGYLAVMMAVVIYSVVTLSDSERGPQDSAWERVQQAGVINVGVDPSIAPFGLWTADNQPTGLDVDLAYALGAELGLEVQLVPLGFDGLYDSLLVGVVDIVIAALRPEPLRLDLVAYSSPYFDAGHVVVSNTADVPAFTTLDNVAVEQASEGDIVARQRDGLTVERFFTAQAALEAVSAGEAPAALVDYISAALYVAEEPTLGLGSDRVIPDPYVIGLRRVDWRLYRNVEEALQTLQADGTVDALIQKWLFAPLDSP